MKSLKILIVEDEVFIAETIKMYLEERNHEVIGSVISYEEAFESYNLRRPDLVLLDIRLYGMKSGIDFAAYLKEQVNGPPFIFLSSQKDQIVLEQALETNPYGYLTKPFYKDSLWTSIDSAYHLYATRNSNESVVIITDGRKNHLIKVANIRYIQADHIYATIIMSSGEKLTVRKTMQQILELANHPNLINCHRSYIINTQHIREWNHESITMDNHQSIPISRGRREEVLKMISQILIEK
jgi:DNA-binding LytR/AlgR family response regulator